MADKQPTQPTITSEDVEGVERIDRKNLIDQVSKVVMESMKKENEEMEARIISVILSKFDEKKEVNEPPKRSKMIIEQVTPSPSEGDVKKVNVGKIASSIPKFEVTTNMEKTKQDWLHYRVNLEQMIQSYKLDANEQYILLTMTLKTPQMHQFAVENQGKLEIMQMIDHFSTLYDITPKDRYDIFYKSLFGQKKMETLEQYYQRRVEGIANTLVEDPIGQRDVMSFLAGIYDEELRNWIYNKFCELDEAQRTYRRILDLSKLYQKNYSSNNTIHNVSKPSESQKKPKINQWDRTVNVNILDQCNDTRCVNRHRHSVANCKYKKGNTTNNGKESKHSNNGVTNTGAVPTISSSSNSR